MIKEIKAVFLKYLIKEWLGPRWFYKRVLSYIKGTDNSILTQTTTENRKVRNTLPCILWDNTKKKKKDKYNTKKGNSETYQPSWAQN